MAAIQPIAQVPWVDSKGMLTVAAVQFLTALQVAATGGSVNIDTNTTVTITGLNAIVNARTDALAAAAGVPVGHFYRNGSVFQLRIT